MRLGAWVLSVAMVGACGGNSKLITRGAGGGGGNVVGAAGATSATAGVGGSASGAGAAAGTGSGHGAAGAFAGNGGIAGTRGGAAGRGSVAMAGMPPVSCDDSSGDPFLGSWQGTVLDASSQPVQTVTLELSRKKDAIVGTFTYGEGDPPAPPTDPQAPWPPDYWSDEIVFDYMASPIAVPAFGYTVLGATGCDATLRFGIASAEPWQAFCGLQTPVHTDPDGWACILRGDASSVNFADGCTTYQHGKLLGSYPPFMCAACGIDTASGYCACSEDDCSANTAWVRDYTLELGSGDAEMLTGSDPSCTGCTLQLERAN